MRPAGRPSHLSILFPSDLLPPLNALVKPAHSRFPGRLTPWRKSMEAERLTVDSERPGVSSALEVRGMNKHHRFKILIVDDESRIRESMSMIFTS
jgi:hypothetical protein